MSILCGLDAFCLSILLVCAIDIIRQTNPLRHPFHAMGFVAMAIGSSAWILRDLAGVVPSWFTILFHSGLAIYSALGAYALWANKRGDESRVEFDREFVKRAYRPTADLIPAQAGRKGRRPSIH